jgi:uncharacterized protein
LLMNAQDIINKLVELKPTLIERYHVKEISLFGSFVRKEQSEDSDIDILAEFDNNADLFDLIGLELYLEDIFEREVDVVPKQALRPELRESILQQIVTV